MTSIEKPAPRINSINRPFFEGCNGDRLMLQRCRTPSCGRSIYFPRVCCPHCGGGELEWFEASGEGVIVTYTVIHRPNHPSFFPEAPYHFVAVRLKEGSLIYSRLVDPPPADPHLIGRAVRVVFVPYTQSQKLPFFKTV